MKKTALIVIVLAILVIAGIVWFGRTPSVSAPVTENTTPTTGTQSPNAPSTSAPATETVKVSSKLSSYQNSELGFSVKYPSVWEADPTNSGITFVMPIDTTQVSTIAKLEASVAVAVTKCAFPPVTTIKDRGTLTVGKQTLNMISMSNNVQGRAYSDRMYSLQSGPVCYMFSFSSIALSTSAKKLTGSNAIQAENNNKAIVTTADAAFTDMVKSFALVVGPQGQDETKVSPIKK